MRFSRHTLRLRNTDLSQSGAVPLPIAPRPVCGEAAKRAQERREPARGRTEAQFLGCNFNNAKSQLGGFPFELSDLSLAVLVLVQLCSLVDVVHPVAKHTVDQSRQLGRHGCDCNWGAELGSESAKLRSQIGAAYP